MSSWSIFLRGMLMGAADIVPGVSGGTVAFITGIYDRLINSISSVDGVFLRRLFTGDIAGAWRHVDGSFLLALLAGIVTSIFSLARLISWALENHAVPLWAFFFGLILASALMLLREVAVWRAVPIACLAGGITVALAIAFSPVGSLDAGFAGVFFAGFFAICAMILPGISGSFILVLLGMYGPVLVAIKSLDMLFVLVFAAGAGCGLICFSRILHWLLNRYHQPTMALLTGFLFGSLVIVWPWKRVLEWVTDSHGEAKPARQIPVSPADYQAISGEDPAIALCIGLLIAGFLLVWLIDSYWGAKRSGA